MKKFTRVLICLMLCVFGVGLIGCGDNRTEKEKTFTYPGARATVEGNGGLAVSKGNYIYFVNGFKNASDSKQGKKSSFGSVMLTKLDKNGNLVVDENGSIEYDNYIHISKTLSGFEATSLNIFGDYLYFTSVCQRDGDNETWAKDIVTFNRIKLDKTSKVEEIYESTSANTNLEFKFYGNSNGVSLLVFEKDSNKLVKVTSGGKKTTISKNVEQVLFADDYRDVCFIKSTSNNELPYKSYIVNAISGNKSEFIDHETKVDLKAVENNAVYMVEDDILCAVSIETKAKEDILTSYSSYKAVSISKDADYVVAVSTEGDGMIFEVIQNKLPVRFGLDEKVTEVNVLGFVDGLFVFRDQDNNIKTFACDQNNATIDTIVKLEGMNTDYFDIDGSYMYFYQKVGSNEYLHRVLLGSGEQEAEFVGVYLQADIPEKTADEE